MTKTPNDKRRADRSAPSAYVEITSTAPARIDRRFSSTILERSGILMRKPKGSAR